MAWDKLADNGTLEKTAQALRKRGFEVMIVDSGDEARKKVLELLPKGSEVMNVTSTTLDQIGVSKDIEDGEYTSLRKMIMSVDDERERHLARKRSLTPEYGIGSVHAVTEDGQVMIASASGSQLPIYAYGADHVIWVVGTQKIVKNLDDAFKRVYEHSLPLESERAHRAYHIPGSSVNKILIFEKETPGRIQIIFVREKLGF